MLYIKINFFIKIYTFLKCVRYRGCDTNDFIGILSNMKKTIYNSDTCKVHKKMFNSVATLVTDT